MDTHHSQEHKHTHSHREVKTKGTATQSLIGVLILSSVYMVVEILGGLWSGSLALLADAGHMTIDVAAIALSIFAAWIAQRPATSEKTFGYFRAEILAALVNGVTLVVISVWICYQAWERFYTPHLVRGEWMTGIAAGGLLVNLLGLALLHRHGQHNLNTRGVWLHLLTDTLGSIAAIVAGFLVWKWGWNLADPIMSIVISLFILYGSWRLLRECVDVLLESVPRGLDVGEIKRAIEAVSGVIEIHDLHVWTVTSGIPSLSVHVGLKESIDPGIVLSAVTKILSEKFHIDHVTIQVEPKGFNHLGEDCNLIKT